MAHPGHPVQAVAIVILSFVPSDTDSRGVHMRIQYDQGDSYGTIISKAQELLGLGPYCHTKDGARCVSMVAGHGKGQMVLIPVFV